MLARKDRYRLTTLLFATTTSVLIKYMEQETTQIFSFNINVHSKGGPDFPPSSMYYVSTVNTQKLTFYASDQKLLKRQNPETDLIDSQFCINGITIIEIKLSHSEIYQKVTSDFWLMQNVSCT